IGIKEPKELQFTKVNIYQYIKIIFTIIYFYSREENCFSSLVFLYICFLGEMMNNKKSLLHFVDASIVHKDIKANDYVVAKVGYFFRDVHERRCKVLIESDLNISLTDSFVIISKEEAEELVREKMKPNDVINYLKEENRSLKEKIKSLEA
ncbi:hypothetical protein, partial [Brachyspira pilosicoli]